MKKVCQIQFPYSLGFGCVELESPNYFRYGQFFTDGTLLRAEEGPKVLASPPTAQMAQAFLSLAVAIYTLGEYNWRHRGDF